MKHTGSNQNSQIMVHVDRVTIYRWVQHYKRNRFFTRQEEALIQLHNVLQAETKRVDERE